VPAGAESFDYVDHPDLLGLAERCYHASVLQRYQDEEADVNDVGPGAFEVIPAIDLRAGRVVRLVEGDFGRERVFADDPAGVADAFATAGARRVHVVDLDGARAGSPDQATAIAAVADTLRGRARLQVAGGLRTLADAEAALAVADRIVLGTSLITGPSIARALVDRHGPARIAAALDVRDGRALGGAWRAHAPGLDLDVAVGRLVEAGIGIAIVTAIERDGRLEGPDLELLARVAANGSLAVVASGGIRDIADLDAVRSAGAAGAIVGRAIYEGRLDLRAALDAFGPGEAVQSGAR
jgi:phosphoribosylformimino-5-aminoimidazole carboxamide ribotide isomerase